MSLIITNAQLDAIEEMMEMSVSEDVRTDYAPRGGTFGKCLGYTGPRVVEFVTCMAMVMLGEGADVTDLLETVGEIGDGTQDNLVHGRIVYWTHIEVEDDDADD